MLDKPDNSKREFLPLRVLLAKLVVEHYAPITLSNSYVQPAQTKGQALIWTNNHLTKNANEPL